MYSLEERKKAVDFYIKNDKNTLLTIVKLGYPSHSALRTWYEDYLEEKRTGIIRNKNTRAPKYTEKKKETAVNHYLEHGRCY